MTDSLYLRAGKRLFDASAAFVGIIFLSPLLIFLALAVLATSGAPVLFCQQRTGRYGKPFSIWKFRTMTHNAGAPGELLTASGDARVTQFGKWLRATKCDELPQLFNVLAGDMSLVGPRPEVPRYTEKYTERQSAVLNVRPGITGPTANHFIAEEDLLAQAPNKESFYLSVLLPAKLERDLRYIQNISFNKDLKLIANTLSQLLMKSRNNRRLMSNAPQGEL